MKWRNKRAEWEAWEKSLATGYQQTTKHFAWWPQPIGEKNVWLEYFYAHHTWYRGPTGQGWWTTVESLSKEPK